VGWIYPLQLAARNQQNRSDETEINAIALSIMLSVNDKCDRSLYLGMFNRLMTLAQTDACSTWQGFFPMPLLSIGCFVSGFDVLRCSGRDMSRIWAMSPPELGLVHQKAEDPVTFTR